MTSNQNVTDYNSFYYLNFTGDRIAWDPIMIVLGCLIVIVNFLLSAKAFVSKDTNDNLKTIV
jgi:uncharacterized membrane protein